MNMINIFVKKKPKQTNQNQVSNTYCDGFSRTHDNQKVRRWRWNLYQTMLKFDLTDPEPATIIIRKSIKTMDSIRPILHIIIEIISLDRFGQNECAFRNIHILALLYLSFIKQILGYFKMLMHPGFSGWRARTLLLRGIKA